LYETRTYYAVAHDFHAVSCLLGVQSSWLLGPLPKLAKRPWQQGCLDSAVGKARRDFYYQDTRQDEALESLPVSCHVLQLDHDASTRAKESKREKARTIQSVSKMSRVAEGSVRSREPLGLWCEHRGKWAHNA
jgi:hypothetical protein